MTYAPLRRSAASQQAARRSQYDDLRGFRADLERREDEIEEERERLAAQRQELNRREQALAKRANDVAGNELLQGTPPTRLPTTAEGRRAEATAQFILRAGKIRRAEIDDTPFPDGIAGAIVAAAMVRDGTLDPDAPPRTERERLALAAFRLLR